MVVGRYNSWKILRPREKKQMKQGFAISAHGEKPSKGLVSPFAQPHMSSLFTNRTLLPTVIYHVARFYDNPAASILKENVLNLQNKEPWGSLEQTEFLQYQFRWTKALSFHNTPSLPRKIWYVFGKPTLHFGSSFFQILDENLGGKSLFLAASGFFVL